MKLELKVFNALEILSSLLPLSNFQSKTFNCKKTFFLLFALIFTGNPRNKTALKPGHSLMDWIRLGSSGVDLAGTGGVITAVSHEELAKHNKVDDCWLALRGRVYNITRYMDFHPGGRDELMRGAGKDATALFDSVHAWVNYEQLLSKCLVGPLRTTVTVNLSNNPVKTPSAPLSSKSPSSSSLQQQQQGGEENLITSTQTSKTPSPITKQSTVVVPRFDWIQKSTDILLTFYTRSLCNPGLIVEQLSVSTIIVKIFIEDITHIYKIKFSADVTWPCTIRLVNETGKVSHFYLFLFYFLLPFPGKIELLFMKCETSVWTNFCTMEKDKVVNDTTLYEFDVQHREEITHDSCALLLIPKEKIIFVTPIGYHVNLTANINGMFFITCFIFYTLLYLHTYILQVQHRVSYVIINFNQIELIVLNILMKVVREVVYVYTYEKRDRLKMKN